MKKIVSGKELQEKMLESIHLLCDTVKTTLGPKGNNVIIDHSCFSTFITNDGVTIAQNIESEDETIGAILEIAKEASIKTNEEVGDGTTSTLVLLESLYEQSIEYINGGKSPILLKKELEQVLEAILKDLQRLKRKPTQEDLKRIATIAANDETLGLLAYQVFQKIEQKEAITIKEIPENKTSITYLKGYTCETTLASLYFLKEKNSLTFEDAYVLLLNDTLTDIENISFLINDMLKNKKSGIIIANDYEEQVVEEILTLSLTENLQVCLLKIEEYGLHVAKIRKDIETITGAKSIENENCITAENIGKIQNVNITKEKTRFTFQTKEEIKKYMSELKKERKELDDELEKEFYEKRIAMLKKGTAEIKLGAPTKTERIEKRMRLEDALCALSVSNQGILLGGGVSLFKIANELKETTDATKIWKEALQKPLEQILKNAGISDKSIQEKIKKEQYKVVYNLSTDTFEESKNTKVIDPFSVITHTLVNATSIASMLLTTTSLIINEYKNNSDKEKEYSEI